MEVRHIKEITILSIAFGGRGLTNIFANVEGYNCNGFISVVAFLYLFLSSETVFANACYGAGIGFVFVFTFAFV